MKINIKKVWSGKSIFIFLRPQNEKGLPAKEQKQEVFKPSKKEKKSNLLKIKLKMFGMSESFYNFAAPKRKS